MKVFQIAILSLGLMVRASSPVLAADLFSDNFDDGDFSDWVVKRNLQWSNPNQPCWYDGRAAHWGLKNGELGMEIYSNPCITEIVPKSLDLTNVQVYEYEFDWNFSESMNMDRSVIFLWQDTNNWYNIKVINNTVQLQKVVNGRQYFLPSDTANYTFTTNKKYHFKITVNQKQKVTVHVNGTQVLEVSDVAPFITGSRTLGLQASVGSNPKSISYFDNITVRSVVAGEKRLNVELFKQTDPAWKNEEYDSASNWTTDKTSIERWGCAMTSMAMVMKYHGMNTLPDGQPLNPSSLNAWLKSQKDGYTKSGGVNFLAATRLTRLIHEKLGTPKLEYSRVPGDSAVAKAEINNNKPVIMEIPGHFIVGDGLTADQSDIFIKDPAYKFTQFSQHKTSLSSLRKLQPSFTDLSYLFFTHTPELQVTIKDGAGQLLASQTSEESIIDPVDNSGQSTPRLAHTQVAKPASGKYTIELKQNQPSSYSLQSYLYDDAANPVMSEYQGLVGSTPLTFEVTYNKTGPSEIKPKVSFSSWRNDLQVTKSLKHLTNTFLASKLDSLAQYAEKSSRERQLRYVQQLKELISTNPSSFTREGRNFLNSQLEFLGKTL